MKIYKIEETHKDVKMNDGRMIRYSKHNTANRWDLPNLNLYSEDGKLLKEESFEVYKFEFLRKLKRIKPFEVNPFLDYQFEHTEDKVFFINHIKPITIHSHYFNDKEERRFLIGEWIREKEKQLEKTPKDEPRKKDLTEKLLAIYFLQSNSLFPTHNTSLGHTQKQFEVFVSNILGESEDAIKKGFQRVRKIVKGTEVVKENKTDRLKQLHTVKNWFDSINQEDISKKIEILIDKINNTSLK